MLSAFRVLEYALRIAKSKKATRVYSADGYPVNGHIIPEKNIPISIENIHTDYSDTGSKIEFKISNKNKLTLYFSGDGGCVLYWHTEGRSVTTPSDFRRAYPINIQVIPVLGPIEQEEVIVADETVRRAAGTPRASRHFSTLEMIFCAFCRKLFRKGTYLVVYPG